MSCFQMLQCCLLNMIFVDFQGVEVALSIDVLQDVSATKPTKQKKEKPINSFCIMTRYVCTRHPHLL